MWSTIRGETGELNFLVGNFWKNLCFLSKFQDNCPRYTIYSATKLFFFQRTDLHFFVKLGTAKNLLGFATFYHIFILLENKLSIMHLKWHLYLKVFLTWLVLSEWVFCCYFVGYGGIITNTNKKSEHCSKINKENELDHGKMFSLLSCL